MADPDLKTLRKEQKRGYCLGCTGCGDACYAGCGPKAAAAGGRETLLISHPACDVESADSSLAFVTATLREISGNRELSGKIERAFAEFPVATKKVLSRAHKSSYLNYIFRGFNPVLKGKAQTCSLRGQRRTENLDAAKVNAALAAPAVVVKAVQRVMFGENKNAFCLVQPAGAGVRGATGMLDDDATGYFNSLIVGARMAQVVFRQKKIAIINLESIKKKSYGLETLATERGYFYANVYEREQEAATQATIDVDNPTEVILSLPTSASAEAVIASYNDRVMKRLKDFRPDVIFLSAGFPSTLGPTDRDSAPHWAMLSEDYMAITRMIVTASNTLCKGRLISVFEDGPETVVLSACAKDHLYALTETEIPKPPPPPPKDRTKWVDPSEAYYNEQIQKRREENAMLKKQLAVINDTLEFHDKHEEDVEKRCLELEILLGEEEETLRPLRVALAPHHAELEAINQKIAAERARVQQINKLFNTSEENKARWQELIDLMMAQIASMATQRDEERLRRLQVDEMRCTELQSEIDQLRRENAGLQLSADSVIAACTLAAAQMKGIENMLRMARTVSSNLDDEATLIKDKVDVHSHMDEDDPTIRRMRQREAQASYSARVMLMADKIEALLDGVTSARDLAEDALTDLLSRDERGGMRDDDSDDGSSDSSDLPPDSSTKPSSSHGGASHGAASYKLEPIEPLHSLVPGARDISDAVSAEVRRRMAEAAPEAASPAARRRREEEEDRFDDFDDDAVDVRRPRRDSF